MGDYLVTYKNGHKEVIRAKSKSDAAMKAGGPVESIREVK